jgi:hypothetical protein
MRLFFFFFFFFVDRSLAIPRFYDGEHFIFFLKEWILVNLGASRFEHLGRVLVDLFT